MCTEDGRAGMYVWLLRVRDDGNKALERNEDGHATAFCLL